MGTLGYMSPEQVKGKPADARSDIFSFGAIFYEMLSGKRAFHGDSAGETMASILREDPPDLSVTNQNISPGLERIVRHCLEKNPERRFQSSSDIAFALQSLSEGSGSVVPGAADPPGPPNSPRLAVGHRGTSRRSDRDEPAPLRAPIRRRFSGPADSFRSRCAPEPARRGHHRTRARR